MVEKKVDRISVRVPSSWKRICSEKGISISFVCRAALFQAMQQSEQVLKTGSKMKSKAMAASLYNSLRPFFVRTDTPATEVLMKQNSWKVGVFREIFLPKATPEELIVLGQFLDQDEFAEEILREVYL